MCGIVGDFSSRGTYVLDEAMEKIASRGSDDKKIYISGNLCLGHTCLLVIEKKSGMQSMSSSGEHYTIIFNGEVYN